MSEDFGNIEAELEALIAALELAGTVAERARRDALRLAQHVRKDPPRSRAEWADRAQLTDAQGRDLGWLDTSKARRVDLGDATGAGDRHITEPRAEEPVREGPGELVEVDGQYFEVHSEAGRGVPEQVRPITVEEAQERITQHRPDLGTRMVGEQDPRLEITRTTPATQQERAQPVASRSPEPAGEVSQEATAFWSQTPAEPSTPPTGGGRSAAEAFGAAPEPRSRPSGAESEAAPSAAELSAVGATRPTETSLSR